MIDLDVFRYSPQEELTMLLRLVVSGVAGGIVGYERESTGKRAGIRTMSLVAMGAAVFTLGSQFGFQQDGVDVSRVAAQVATGVGFIGAGTIVVHRGSVRGLTTAAAIWVAAALGLVAGAGMLVLALAGALLTTLALALLPHTASHEVIEGEEPRTDATVEDTNDEPPDGAGGSTGV